MKQIKSMSQIELAAYVQDSLQVDGINVVLSGGSAVSFYSSNKYVSEDIEEKLTVLVVFESAQHASAT